MAAHLPGRPVITKYLKFRAPLNDAKVDSVYEAAVAACELISSPDGLYPLARAGLIVFHNPFSFTSFSSRRRMFSLSLADTAKNFRRGRFFPPLLCPLARFASSP